MVQVNRTAEDVANMETELYDLRNDNVELRRVLTIAETERNMLRVEVILLQKKADERLERMTKVEAMITHLASGLHAGLKEMREEREIARAVHRMSQEHQLEVGSETSKAPAFLRDAVIREARAKLQSPRDDVDTVEQSRRPTPEEDAQDERDEQDRQDRLRGSAERIAMAPPAVRPVPPMGRPTPRAAIVDHTLADRDPRMPEMGDYRSTTPPPSRADYDADQEALRDLAKRIG